MKFIEMFNQTSFFHFFCKKQFSLINCMVKSNLQENSRKIAIQLVLMKLFNKDVGDFT
jgi:hypothetical protein